MNNNLSRNSRWSWILAGGLLLLVLFLVFSIAGAEKATPEKSARSAWNLLQQVGRYSYSTTIEQITYPAPAVANVGSTSRTDIYYVNGTADLKNQTFAARLVHNQGSAATLNDGIDIRIENGKTEGRVDGSSWQEIKNFTSGSLIANSNGVDFLQAAVNFRFNGMESVQLPNQTGALQTLNLEKYSFFLDPVRYAEYLRDQMLRELQRSGKLPAGINLGLSEKARAVDGSGELWIDTDGLPVRMLLRLKMPEEENGEHVEALISTEYKDFSRSDLLQARSLPVQVASLLGLPTNPRDLLQNAATGGLVAAMALLVILTAVFSGRKTVYAVVSILVILLMLFSPIWQAVKAAEFTTEMAARQNAQESDQVKAQKEKQQAASLVSSDWNPDRPQAEQPLFKQNSADAQPAARLESTSLLYETLNRTLAAPAAQISQEAVDQDQDGLTDEYEGKFDIATLNPALADTDGDGLKDGVEVRLGLLPGEPDSDQDGILDAVEVAGYWDGFKTRYPNPLERDTDKDGQLDGLECPGMVTNASHPTPEPCRDTDNDGIADIFDSDDDGDGIPTYADESPYYANSTIYSAASPFKLQVNGAGIDRPMFVDYQLIPKNLKHLTYTLNVLDWPGQDNKGQIMRMSDTTFATSLTEAQRQADGRAKYGDMRLVPMLEIKVTGLTIPFPFTSVMDISIQSSAYTGKVSLSGIDASLTRFQVQDGPTGSRAFYTASGSCDKFATPLTLIGTLSKGGETTMPLNLASFADGNRVLIVKNSESASDILACQDVRPAAHGSLKSQVIDQTLLSAYGGVARDDSDHKVLVYVPLNLVYDYSGGKPLAFSARIPYTNQENRLNTSSQEVRVVWVVNMMTDVCLPIPASYDESASGTWCDTAKPERWIKDQTRIVQTYPEEFKVTGISVREDHGVDMGVIFENPGADPDPDVDDQLWAISKGLQGSFLAGRTLNGARDMTLAEIEHRFDPDHNGDIPADDVRLWALAKNAFQVERYSYTTSDGVQEFISSQARTLFQNYFDVLGAAKPTTVTLLFAREQRSRAVGLGDSPSMCGSGTCQFDFSSTPLNTQVMLNWAPYRWSNSAWETYPLDDYLDSLEARLRQTAQYTPTEGTQEEKEVIDGQMVIARMYYQAMYRGYAFLVSVGSTILVNAPSVEDDTLNYNTFKKHAGKASAVAGIIKFLAEQVIKGLMKNPDLAFRWFFGSVADKTVAFFKALKFGLKDALKLNGITWKHVVGTAVVIVIVAALVVCLIYSMADPNSTAGRVMGRIFTTTMGLIAAAVAIKALVNAVQVLRGVEAVSKAAQSAAVIGLIVSLVLTWGVFIASWAMSGESAFSLNFNNMLADAIAATCTIILMAALASTGVGAIVVAVIALIDGLITAICAAAGAYEQEPDHWARKYVCIGISGWITFVFKWIIYSQTFIVNYDSGSRLSFTGLSQGVRDNTLGMVPANALSYSLNLTNTITKSSIPFDWKAAVFAWQYGDSYAKSAAFAYKLQPSEADIHGGLERYTDSGTWVDVPNESTKWSQNFTANTDGASITMPAPGINRDPGVYFSEGAAVPVQECIAIPVFFPVFFLIPVCWVRTYWGTSNTSLGGSLTVDVFPNTLDEFYVLESDGGSGYRLAWGRDAQLKFSVLKDADGDGLLSKAYGGNDPDDHLYDTDSDGLSDYFELTNHLNPRSFDTDEDGLYDIDELAAGTDPLRKDSDGDGLNDKEELEGWLYTYAFTVSGSPLETMVYSDPLFPDTDFDGITDFLEKAYGFNPRVTNQANVLEYSLSMREWDSPLVMTRFDENSGTEKFADAANFGFEGTCSGAACPVSGITGRYGKAARFDGADLVRLPTSAKVVSLLNNHPFTLAGWVNLESGGNGTLISKWSDAANARREFRFEMTADRRLRLVGAQGTVTSSSQAPASGWTHIAAVFTGTRINFLIDGTLSPTCQESAGCAWSNNPVFPADAAAVEVWLGASQGSSSPTSFFTGKMDEMALFDRALTNAEISTRLMTGRYNFNDNFLRPGEEFEYQSVVTNLLESRYAYTLLSTSADHPEVIENAAAEFLPQTFTLWPNNHVSTNNVHTSTNTLKVKDSVNTTTPLKITQTAAAQIVDRRSESNFAELWLQLDEAADATSFQDFSGSLPERISTCAACPTRAVDGMINRGVAFAQNSNSPIQLPSLETLKLVNGSSTSYTISVWVLPAATPPTVGLLSVLKTPGNQFGLSLRETGGDYVPVVYLNGSELSLTDVYIGRKVISGAWNHLALQYNGVNNQLNVIVNGMKTATGASIPHLNQNADLYLGGTPMEAALSVDDLRIFSRPLTIVDTNRLAEKPVLQLNLETYSDSSKYAQPVTSVHNSLALSSNGVRGYSMDPGTGSTQGHLQVSGKPSLNMRDGAFTYSTWIYPRWGQIDQWQGIFGYDSGESNAYPSLERKGLQLRFGFGDGSTFTTYTTGNVLSENQWNHVVVTFAPSSTAGMYEFILYINGDRVESSLFSAAPPSSSVMYVGHSSRKYVATGTSLRVDNHHDAGDHAEPYGYMEVSNGYTVSILGETDMEPGESVNFSNSTYTAWNNESVYYHIKEADPPGNPDDNCGGLTLYWWYDAGGHSTYIDAEIEGLISGSLSRNSVQFRGLIDQFEVYRYPLDSEQVFDLYNSIPLSAYLPLDDRPTTSTFVNRVGIGTSDDGGCSGSACPAAGSIGLIDQMVRFDGVDDQITVDVTTAADNSVSLWVNTSCTNCGIYTLESISPANPAVHQIYLKGGNACALDQGTEICTSGGIVSNGEWHHIFYTNSGSQATLWLDGAVANNIPISGGVTVNSGIAHLGYAVGAARPAYFGQLDDVRIFRLSQTTRMVSQLLRRAPLFLAHLDDATARSGMGDATPYDWALDCVYSANPASDQCPKADVKGRLGRSVEFDGVNDQLALRQAQLSATASSFAVSLWVYPTRKINSPQTLWTIGSSDNTRYRYSLGLAADSLRVCLVGSADGETCGQDSNVDLIMNNWNFVTLVVASKSSPQPDEYWLYINGYLDSSSTGNAYSASNLGLGKLTLGGKQATHTAQPGGPFGGQLDEPTVFEYLLNEIDVRDSFYYQMTQVEERAAISMTIDADLPSASLASYNPAFPYYANTFQQLHLDASDQTSGMGLVEMQINRTNQPTQVVEGPKCRDAASLTAFCPGFTPPYGEGAYTLGFRAMDQVGHQYQTNVYPIFVDGTPPRVQSDLLNQQIVPARKHDTQKHTWYVRLSGKVTDEQLSDGSPGSGMDPQSVQVTLLSESGLPVGAGTQAPTLTPITGGFNWAIDYILPEKEPSGKLNLVVDASDRVGNQVKFNSVWLYVDATPPKASVDPQSLPNPQKTGDTGSTGSPGTVLSGGNLSGSVSDIPTTDPATKAPYMTDNGVNAAVNLAKVEVEFAPSANAPYPFLEPYPTGQLAWLPLDQDSPPLDPNGDPNPSSSKRLFLDISPAQIMGECEGGACPTAAGTGHKGGSVYFAGNGQYINLGKNVDLSNRSFSVSIWAKRDQVGRNDPILWQGPLSVTNQRFLFGIGTDNRFVCGFGGSDLLSPVYTDTDWHDWTCTYDQSTRQRSIFRDGQKVASDTSPAMLPMNENLLVGLAPVGSFQGYLDELIILDLSLSEAEVRQQHTGYHTVYQLAVDSDFYTNGNRLPDRSGYFQSSVLSSGTGDALNKVTAGKVGHYGLAFDGNDKLLVQPAYSLRLDRGAFTLSAWVKPSGSGERDIFSQRDENPERRYTSLVITADNRLRIGFGTGYEFKFVESEQAVIQPGVWSLIAATFDGTEISLYVNESRVLTSQALAGEKPYPAERFNLGEAFTGSLDDLRVYTRALSWEEILFLARMGWRDAQLSGSGLSATWSTPVLSGIEGPYQLNVRGWDKDNHFATDLGSLNYWGGVIDTKPPILTIQSTPVDPAQPNLVQVTFTIEDLLLDESSIRQNLCKEATLTRTYNNSSWYLGTGVAPDSELFKISATCQVNLITPQELGILACDYGNNCSGFTFPPVLNQRVYLPAISGGQGSGIMQPRGFDNRALQALKDKARAWSPLVEVPLPENPGGAGPKLELLTSTITSSDFRTPFTTLIKGRASDPAGIAWVNVKISQDGKEIQSGRVSLSGENWNAMWVFPPGSKPVSGVYQLEVNAANRAGGITSIRNQVTLDLNR